MNINHATIRVGIATLAAGSTLIAPALGVAAANRPAPDRVPCDAFDIDPHCWPPSGQSTASGREALLLPSDRALDPGTYFFGADPVFEHLRVRVTVPPGWTSADGHAVGKDVGEESPAWMGVAVWSVGAIYADPCHWIGTEIEPDPSVEGLVAAFVEHRQATSLVDIVVDGYPGTRLQVQVPTTIDFADCDGSEFRSFTDSRGGVRYHQGPGQIDELSIIDVDGVPLVIDVNHFPGTSEQDLAEQDAVFESIRIRPAVSFSGVRDMSLSAS
jgi:hypothetical protein